MAKAKQKDPFWTSYSDLMTSLFFVMLVLFIICLVKVGGINKKLRGVTAGQGELIDSLNATNTQLKNILQLEEQFKVLSQSSSLEYDSVKKMFYARDFQDKEIFVEHNSQIKPKYYSIVDSVGFDILHILQSLDQNQAFKYQMVIEGYAAIEYQNLICGNYNPDNVYPYRLSYDRALALYLYWKEEKNIDFRKYNTEVIIAGSGFNGINRDDKVEENNKRFVIQIIPKINRPKVNN